MKILIATGIYPPTLGGPATYSKLLYDELPKRGIKVKVFSYDEVRKYPKGLSHMVYLLKLVPKLIGVDIIYAQDPVSVGFPSMIVAKLLRKKFVLKIVGDFAWEQGVNRFGVTDNLDEFVKKDSGYKSDVIRLKGVQTKVAKAADKIIVPSHYLKSIIGAWGIDESKIKVIYNGFSGISISEDKETLRNRLDIKCPTITTVGRLVPWKGIGALIEIIPELLNQFPNLNFLIIGDGPLKVKLEDLISANSLTNNVQILGRVPREKVHEYLKASDVFVLNTNYEGFSHVLLEAMAFEVPIITTSVGGNPEMITDGANGFLVEYNDKVNFASKISQVLSDKELGQSLVRDASIRIKKFGKKNTIDEVIKELESVV